MFSAREEQRKDCSRLLNRLPTKLDCCTACSRSWMLLAGCDEGEFRCGKSGGDMRGGENAAMNLRTVTKKATVRNVSERFEPEVTASLERRSQRSSCTYVRY